MLQNCFWKCIIGRNVTDWMVQRHFLFKEERREKESAQPCFIRSGEMRRNVVRAVHPRMHQCHNKSILCCHDIRMVYQYYKDTHWNSAFKSNLTWIPLFQKETQGKLCSEGFSMNVESILILEKKKKRFWGNNWFKIFSGAGHENHYCDDVWRRMSQGWRESKREQLWWRQTDNWK